MVSDAVAVPGRVAGSRVVPVGLAAATVLAQVAYPLTPAGPARDRLTVATVVLFFAASVSHSLLWRGPRFTARLVAVTCGGGLLVEAAGVATGVPFGAYDYSGTLGWQVLGVPAVIPLAWTMMAYPALLVGRRVAAGTAGVVVAGWALASWDLFLDPQMVAAGHWAWAGGNGPEVLGIPVLNFAAWFVVGTAMMAALWRAVPPAAADDRVPLGLYLWVYASSVLAHAAFFGLPGSALLGGLGMGIVVVALVRALRR